MQRKKIFSILSVVLCATVLTACGGDQRVTFSEYWQKNPDSLQNGTEILTYAVEHTPDDGLGYNYSVTYSDGVYTTKLTREIENNAAVFTYETSLTIKVTYKVGNDTLTFDDYTNSKVIMQDVGHGLSPVSSEKDMYNHLLPNKNVESINDFKSLVSDYRITTTYGDTNKSVVQSRELKNPQDPSEGYKYAAQELSFTRDANYTYLDNDQLLFALRAVNPVLTTSATFEAYAPFSAEMQKISATFSKAETGDFEFAIEGGTKTKYEIHYYPVSMTIQANNSRETQELKIAKFVADSDNTFRNVVLEWTDPIHYSYGSLVYKLTDANFIG